MNNLILRDRIIVLTVIFSGIIYGFYAMLYTPLKDEKDALGKELHLVEIEYPESSLTSLESRSAELLAEKNDFQNKIDAIKEVKNFGDVNYQDFITFLGGEAFKNNVEITKINKKELINTNSYWEREYEMMVEGEYNDLVKYINSMYSYDKYFVIKGLKIAEVKTIPMTEKVSFGEAEIKKEIDYHWFDDFSGKLDSTIPSKYLILEGSESAEVDLDYVKTRTRIHFSFSFISLEEPIQE